MCFCLVGVLQNWVLPRCGMTVALQFLRKKTAGYMQLALTLSWCKGKHSVTTCLDRHTIYHLSVPFVWSLSGWSRCYP